MQVDQLAPHWVGHIFGTNTGRLHLRLGSNASGNGNREGMLRVSDDNFGASSYEVVIVIEDHRFFLTGVPSQQVEGVQQGNIDARGEFDPRGHLHGEWQSSIGTGGPFDLYPHRGTARADTKSEIEQIYTSNRELGALRLYRTDLEEILSVIHRKFPESRVIVSHIDRGAELALFDDEFTNRLDRIERLDWIKLSVQSPAGNGLTKSLTIDLGRSFNRITTQGPDEAWVLGEIEATASALRRREHRLSTAVGKYKVGINQVIFIASLVAMPDLPLPERGIFILGVIALIFAAGKAAEALVPNFVFNLREDKPSWISQIWPSAVSWAISLTSAVAASFLFDWLR